MENNHARLSGSNPALSQAQYYAALKARDARFDGHFFVGVSSTGIYCRPICTVKTPKAENCTFHLNPAAAEAAGYRPCLRCRPELAPGVARFVAPVDALRVQAHWAAARIEEGALNEGDLDTLAARYGRSARQLRRAVCAEYGVSPVELAQTRRLLLAKQLLTDSGLPMAEVAQASGFSSLRRFNHLFKTRYGLNPGALRRQGGVGVEAAVCGEAAIVLKLAYRPPFDWPALLRFLTSRGASGMECAEGQRYWRTVSLNGCRGWLSAEPWVGQAALRLTVSHSLLSVLTPLLVRVRRLFDLDANPTVIAAHLVRDKRLRGFLKQSPGLRIPGAFDGFEVALRAVLGQQVSVKAATTVFNRIVMQFGDVVTTPQASLQRICPGAERLAAVPESALLSLGLNGARARAVLHLARAVAGNADLLDGTLPLAEVRAALLALPGFGAWTVEYIAMRALGDPDAFPHSDLGLMKALNAGKPRELLMAAEAWRPWRGYAAIHLWNSLSQGG